MVKTWHKARLDDEGEREVEVEEGKEEGKERGKGKGKECTEDNNVAAKSEFSLHPYFFHLHTIFSR